MPENLIYSFSYEGIFSHSFLEESVNRFETEVMPLLPINTFKTFMFCATEFIQNVGFYSLTKVTNSEGKEYGAGSISITIDAEAIHLKSVNKVDQTQFGRILAKITNLNTLTQDELKLLKKEKLKSAQEHDSKGGGIGFIEMIRRSGSPIFMNQEFSADQNLTLELTINYKAGETNG
jgi:hypothetical protein